MVYLKINKDIRVSTISFYLLFFAILSSSLTAFAGGGALDGGGGRSVVCRNKANKITSATLLDIYEGSLQFGYKYPKSDSSPESYISKITTLIKRGTRVPFDYYFDSVQKNLKFLPKGTALAPINDSHEFILPTSCKIEQVANFVNPKLVLVVQEIWDKFDNLNKAALVTHEALYWKARITGATDSRRSRYLVSYLFSDNASLVDVYEGLTKDSILCIGMTKNFGDDGNLAWVFYVRNENQTYGFQFLTLAGNEVFSKKTIFLGKDFVDKILHYSEHPVSEGTEKVDESSNTGSTTKAEFEPDDVLTFSIKHEKYPDQNLTWTRLYISGQSGWNPSGKYEKAVFGCSKNNNFPIPDKK